MSSQNETSGRNRRGSTERHLVILFGKAGAGKNYVAKIFHQQFGFFWYDADTHLTDEMVQSIREHRRFTDAMRTEFLEIIKMQTQTLLLHRDKVVLSQGLFMNRDRRDLVREFPFARLVWIDAAQELLEARILKRHGGISAEYARIINEHFEEPDFECSKIVNNDGEQEIVRQINTIVSDLPPVVPGRKS